MRLWYIGPRQLFFEIGMLEENQFVDLPEAVGKRLLERRDFLPGESGLPTPDAPVVAKTSKKSDVPVDIDTLPDNPVIEVQSVKGSETT